MRRRFRSEKLVFKPLPPAPELRPKLGPNEQELLDQLATEALFPSSLIPLLDTLYPYMGYRAEEFTYELVLNAGRFSVRSEPWMHLKSWVHGKVIKPSPFTGPKTVDLPQPLEEAVTNIFMAQAGYDECRDIIQNWHCTYAYLTNKQAVAVCPEVQWLIPSDRLTGRKTTRPPSAVAGEGLTQLKAAIAFVKVLGGI